MKAEREQEFESAIMPHVNALFQTALQLIEDRAAAKEVVKEVCGAWRASGRRDPPADWRLPLFKLLIQRARRRALKKTKGSALALSGMPRAEREVLLLVDCHDFSYQQAADILDCSRDEIAETVTRGRTRLESTIGAYCEVR